MQLNNPRTALALAAVVTVILGSAMVCENVKADTVPIGVTANPTDDIGPIWRILAYSICDEAVSPGCYPGTHVHWPCITLSPGIGSCAVPEGVPVAYQHLSGNASPKRYYTLPEPPQWMAALGGMLILFWAARWRE